MTNTIETINGINKETGKQEINKEVLKMDVEVKKGAEAAKNVLNVKRSIGIDKDLKAVYAGYGLDVLYIRSKYQVLEQINTLALNSYNSNVNNIVKVVKSIYISKDLSLDEMNDKTVLSDKQRKTVETIVKAIEKHKRVSDSKEQIKLLHSVIAGTSSRSEAIEQLKTEEKEAIKSIFETVDNKLLKAGINNVRDKAIKAVTSKQPDDYNQAYKQIKYFYKTYLKITIPDELSKMIFANIVNIRYGLKFENSKKINTYASFKKALAYETAEVFKLLVNKNQLYKWKSEELPVLIKSFNDDNIVKFCKDINTELATVIHTMIKNEINGNTLTVEEVLNSVH